MEKEYLTQLYEANKKIQKLVEALEFYADESHYQKECVDSRTGAVEEVIIDNGRIARNTLEECGL
jgi:hypothetical protein